MNQRNYKGQRHGPWEAYYDNGQLWYKWNYVNGRYHGIYEEYWLNGQVYSKGIFKYDQRIGLWLIGNSNGKIDKEFVL